MERLRSKVTRRMKLEEKCVHCAVLGDGMVGKTSLTLGFTEHFTANYEKTVFENHAVYLKVGGHDFMVSLFDTAGQTDFESVRAVIYKECEVIILCFSVCDRSSFTSIPDLWFPEVMRHMKSWKKKPVILVGTQTDLRDKENETVADLNLDGKNLDENCEKVSSAEGKELATSIGAECYLECSARRGEGLQELFENVVGLAIRYKKKKQGIIRQILTCRFPVSSGS